MNHESSTETGSKDRGSIVIKPWLSGGLIVAIVGNFVLSGVLILQLSTFEDTRRQAQEVEAGIAKARTELATLQVEVESLTKQKEALAPTIVDWEKRVKEKAEAEALLATVEAKKRQIESDTALDSQRLGEINQNLVSAEKQQSELNSEIEKIRRDLASLTKTKTDAEAVLAMATEAERRWNEAQNALTSAEARRKQVETDANQLQKEVDDDRQIHDKLNTDASTLRQQIQALKDELSASQPELQARQAAVQQEEQKLTKLQTDAKTVLTMATDAERRSNEARNAVTSAEARRKQLETDASQLQKEVDDARQVHDKLNTDASTLRQQIQTLKDELAASQSQSSDLQGRQAAVQQEEQKLTKLQQLVTSAETRLNELNEQEEKQRRESEGLTNRLEQIHKEVTDGELRRDTAKADFQKADSDLSSARKLLQEISAKHDELIRESSDLETAIDRLTKEKETKEKELGQLDAQRPTSPKADQ